MTTPAAADAELVRFLLETDFEPAVGDVVSTIAAAIREARTLTGREPITGSELLPNDLRATWAGALVWFIVLEQLATCFRPTAVQEASGRDPIACALVWFGGIDTDAATNVDRLRDRFAHDYSLETPDGSKRYRLGITGPLFKAHNRTPRVSLYELANTAEHAVASVRGLAGIGALALRLPANVILRRFTMQLEPGDLPPVASTSTGPLGPVT